MKNVHFLKFISDDWNLKSRTLIYKSAMERRLSEVFLFDSVSDQHELKIIIILFSSFQLVINKLSYYVKLNSLFFINDFPIFPPHQWRNG